eukprot:5522674-Alexandrium_andersonii.AAC.1
MAWLTLSSSFTTRGGGGRAAGMANAVRAVPDAATRLAPGTRTGPHRPATRGASSAGGRARERGMHGPRRGAQAGTTSGS